MNRATKRAPWTVVLGLATLSPGWAVGEPSYSATAITTRVVDADTKEPIEGVIVVADWQLQAGGGVPGQLMLLETVTDHAGTFHFPAWGPKKAFDGWLANRDPEILLFKDGYRFKVAQNPFRSVGSEMPTGTRTSIYDGKVIVMQKFTGNLREWGQHVESVSYQIDGATSGTHCEWKNVPRLLAALENEGKKLLAAGVTASTSADRLARTEAWQANQGCGSVREFLKEHAQRMY